MSTPKSKINASERVFDDLWIQNRFRYRRKMTGERMVVTENGYLEAPTKRGFKAKDKEVFIERYRHCKNTKQVAASIPIDIQSVYDAVATDKKFRDEFIICRNTPNRLMQLTNSLKELKVYESQAVLKELVDKAKKYI